MTRRRATSLSPPEFFLLEHWGRTIRMSFGEPPYLVGSVARAEEWRDVDVRLMLSDDRFADLAPNSRQLIALNVAMSMWGRHVTGLPIDFQFQDTTTTNAEHHGIRNALGVR